MTEINQVPEDFVDDHSLRLEMREMKSDDGSNDVYFEVLNENGDWHRIPFVIGAYIKETMPQKNYSMIEWKIIQVYAYALAQYPLNEEKAGAFIKATTELFPETIDRYVTDMGWKNNDNA